MAEASNHSVLKRMAEAGRPRPDSAAMTPPRALTQALALAAQHLMTLPLAAAAATESRLTLADLPDILEDRSLLAVLEGPGEALGLVALAPGTMAALIEMQTMGRLLPGTPDPRRPTRTDAAMCADFIDRALAELEAQLADTADAVWAGGFRYASFLEDPRPLGLILEDCSYRVLRLTLGLGNAPAREGGLILALPASGRGAAPRAVADAVAAAPAGPAWQDQLEARVLGATARIDAVLCRLTLPLADAMRLRVGETLILPADALGRVSLEDAAGQKLAEAKLGQFQGCRALRIGEADAAARQVPAPPPPAAEAAMPPPAIARAAG